ncbi:SGNH/GDSL hydrolase family protein [Flavobacterium sp. RHBU_3]|uniref:SGNH/GDSL hydrolase family protein n=1 Tax=Flavobacterium sp. RHBU_3 TaxID=3391184 RepID=UPI0039851005
MIKLKVLFTLLICFIASNGFSQVVIKPGNKKICYTGRVEVKADSTQFYWPGTSIKIAFKGTGASVKMKSLKEKADFYAIVDNDADHAFRFQSDSEVRTFTVAQGLNPGKHTLEIYKLTNSTSKNIFYGFELEGKASLLKFKDTRTRKIVFYGNSITAGHGVDVPEGGVDAGTPEQFNNYYTYGAITARHFNAKASIVARSGIGIMVSWFPEIMPETFGRIDPLDPNSKYDFNVFQPDVVVVNLFQNDSWLVKLPEHEQFKSRFGTTKPTEDFIVQSYKNFISSVREKHPQASIICALGNMDATQEGSPWPDYIRKAVGQLEDENIYITIFPYKNTGSHPVRKEQQAMADQLIEFIEGHITW